MDLKLLDLRRYAIEKRVGIKFTHPDTGQEFLIDNKGQVKIPQPDEDVRIEDVLASARSFQLTGQGKPLSYTRDQMGGVINEALKKRGSAPSPKEEE